MLAALFTIAVLTFPAQPPDSPALIAAYREAVAQMGAVPKYLAFRQTIVSQDVDVRIFRDDDGVVHTGIVTGRPNGGRAAVDIRYRGEDEMASLGLADGTAGLSHSPFYDPTWPGMRSWLKYGLQGAPVDVRPETPQAEAAAAEQAQAAARSALISVRAVTVAFYRLEDRGPAACPDGSGGRAIHMTAYRNVDEHPLSDVVISNEAGRFCSMRFHLYVPGAVSFHGFVDLQFTNVASYYLATAGVVEGDVDDVTGVETRHARIAFSRSDFAFPASISAANFQPRIASSP